MGAKTALLAYATGSVAEALRDRTAEAGRDGGRDEAGRDTAGRDAAGRDAAGRDAAEAFLRRVHPGWRIAPLGDEPHADLAAKIHPPDDIAYAASFPGLDILCSRTVMLDRPSELPQHYLDAADGRTVVLHAMHSVTDWFAFAVWQDGVLVRSLSVSPRSGVMEDIGDHLPVETAYWAGGHPVEPEPGWPDQNPYPLPFHPLHLGEEVLRALFGFIAEGLARPGDIDARAVPVYGFDLVDPAGPSPEQRAAVLAALRAEMGPPRMVRRQGGALVEVDDILRLLGGK